MMLGFAVVGAANAAGSFAYPSFSDTVARAALASAGACLFISIFTQGTCLGVKNEDMLAPHEVA